MATARRFVEAWQSCAFEVPEYAKGDSYSTILSLLLEAGASLACENSISNAYSSHELRLQGNRPELSKTRLGDRDVAVLTTALSGSGTLTLDLSYNAITDTGIAHLAEHLKDPNCSLKNVNLAYNDFGPEGTEALSIALQFNTTVSVLCMDGCKMGHVGGIQVAAMLQVNHTIQQLSLANTDLDTDCIIAMATVLQGNQSLQSVDISRPLLHSRLEESTIHLSRMLQVNGTLQELNLSKHSITDTGVEWLCRHLRENSALLYLNISCNSLSRDGAGHLATLLQANSPLTSLNINNNRIEDDGLCSISHALAFNHTLTRLNVCSNSIGDKGLCSLAEALKRNDTLIHISIWGNNLGEPTCKAFQQLLESSRLLPSNVDVQAYEVDGVTYLARTG